MTELLTAAQMRAIEHTAIDAGVVTGLDLMARAGRGVVAAIYAQWPSLGPPAAPEQPDIDADLYRAVVLCGPGNNGGDGFVVARLLKQDGWDVAVYAYGDMTKLPPDADANYQRWLGMGGVLSLDDPTLFAQKPDLWVDAIFGIGLTRAVPDDVYVALDHVAATVDATCRSVCIDMPSWFDSDTGWHLGRDHRAVFDLTVTFHAPKLGHYIGVARDFIAQLRVVDIGLGRAPMDGAVALVDDAGLAGLLDKGAGHAGQHKYSHGHALVLSGGVGKGGAARLAARAALRVGAGAVTVGCPPAALIENAAQLNAVMLRAVKDADALADTLQDDRINAMCVGPGMGVSDQSARLIAACLAQGRRIVLDADALTLIGRDAGLFALLHDRCVLTPHAGEFARVVPEIAARLKEPGYSKVDATRDAAVQAGCVVLLKGPDTVIADPTGRCGINASVYDRSAPWLATAGSGDVLAGFITGLLARGFSPMQAAQTGAWLHTQCALCFGPGLIAEDLTEALPKVLRTLGL